MRMTTGVVLLRGVNVGANNRIRMPAFRELLEGVGCTEVQTYLQSGNAVATLTGSAASLESAVEQALREQLDLPVRALVRTAAELGSVVDGNPFADEQLDPKLLHVLFLAGPAPSLDAHAALPDRIVPGERVIYVAYDRGSQNAPAAKVLGSKQMPVSSARNWRTVLALHELCQGRST